MVSKTTPLNAIQKIPYISVKGTAVNFGTTPEIVYTCPTGKKALIITATTMFVAFGTGTRGQSNYGSVRGRSVNVADANPVSEPIALNLVLNAGETISFSGDAAGNNETANYNFSVQETPQ